MYSMLFKVLELGDVVKWNFMALKRKRGLRTSTPKVGGTEDIRIKDNEGETRGSV